jgi:hypothetical protein
MSGKPCTHRLPKAWIGALVISLVMVACQARPSSLNPAQSKTVTALASESLISSQPSHQAFPTSTPALPTNTPRFTQTATPSPEPSLTSVSMADIAATVVASSPFAILQTLISPDGQWRAEVLNYPCTTLNETEQWAYDQIRLTKLSDGSQEIIETQLRYCEGLGAFGLGGLRWTSDSRYLYYTTAREGSPDGGSCAWDRPLIRHEIATGAVDNLTQGPVSPDGSEMIMRQEDELVIWDFEKGEIARTSALIPRATISGMAWSPDGQSIAYLQIVGECFMAKDSSLVLLDTAGLEHNLLLESKTPAFIGLEWLNQSELRLFTLDGQKWDYNLQTEELTPQG